MTFEPCAPDMCHLGFIQFPMLNLGLQAFQASISPADHPIQSGSSGSDQSIQVNGIRTKDASQVSKGLFLRTTQAW